MQMKKYIHLVLGTASVFSLHAQDFKINAEIKPRYEFRNGFGQLRPAKDSLDKAASFVSQRSRISILYANTSQKMRMGGTMQDVRNWGTTDQMNIGDKNNFGLHEFWAEVLLTNHFSIKVGRQELSYDNQRILGNVDWAQQARSFDAALMKYEDSSKQFKLHAALGLNTKTESLVKEVYDINNYKSFQFIWINKKYKNVSASFLFLNNGLEYTVNPALPVTAANRKVAFSQTIGSRLEFSKSKLKANTEGYYQGGKTTGNKKIAAWNLGMEITVNTTKGITPVAGAEWLSGNDINETDGKNHSFNPFYGTNHKFNGTMDYFYVGGRWLNKAGLADYYVGFRYQKNKFGCELIEHVFNSMGKVVINNNLLKKGLGLETDLMLRYKVSDIITFESGLSFLSGSNTLVSLTPGSNKEKLCTWGWTQLIFKPNLFSFKK